MTDDQIIEALATKVMGWTKGNATGPFLTAYWYNGLNCTNYTTNQWNPLTNPADSKMVREKLAEQGYRRQELKRSWIEPTVYSFEIERREHRHASGYEVTTGPHADTEERAVALCALKMVGVETSA